MTKILVVDDERSAREFMRLLLEQEGYETLVAGDGVEALVELEGNSVDMVVSDLHMPEMGGAELLSHVRQRWADLPMIMVTAASDVEDIVEVVQRGATNYLIKPASPQMIASAVQRALATAGRPRPAAGALDEIVGTSKAMVEVRHRVTLAARSDVPVLITGATGTGKELVARAIHDTSGVAEGPFVPHNCALTPRDLFESHFFGHKKGSFTGADTDHVGLLREADGGVLFLDELEAMAPVFQAKLLRVLDDGEVRPVGSDTSSQVSIRFVAATNRDAQAMIEAGELREDLYYRLRGFEIRLPPLAERPQDISSLVRHFLPEGSPEPHAEVVTALEAGVWPGNVRELRNVIRGAAAVAGGAAVGLEHLPPGFGEGSGAGAAEEAASTNALLVGSLSLKELEKRAIRQAMDECSGNRSKAARLLEIDRSTLRRKLQEFGLDD
ncbi:MAG: sigma-54 dependent transcriptional regulator [Myxococcota bacterium]|nr:sigma-54 dependent transcriptional regulator [Myxococcota bacterium]